MSIKKNINVFLVRYMKEDTEAGSNRFYVKLRYIYKYFLKHQKATSPIESYLLKRHFTVNQYKAYHYNLRNFL